MEMSGQLYAPAIPPLPPGESPYCPLDRRLGEPTGQSGRSGKRKKIVPTRNQTHSQQVTSLIHLAQLVF